MEQHASKVCASANYYLQCIRKIRDCINVNSCKILVHALVTSRLDYANTLLHNTPQRITHRLERVQRFSARVICRLHSHNRISMTEVLHDLHWLPVTTRIKYKILVLVFKAIRSGTPRYLAELLVIYKPAKCTRSQDVSAPE